MNLVKRILLVVVMSKDGLCEDGLEAYSANQVVLSNLMMALWVALGTIACRSFSSLAGWAYLGVALMMILVILRKVVCPNCYYYGKRCHTGWGMLSTLLFKRGDVANFGKGISAVLPPATYALLGLVPLALGTVSVAGEFSVVKLMVLVALLVVAVYCCGPGRRSGCAHCKVGDDCQSSLGRSLGCSQ